MPIRPRVVLSADVVAFLEGGQLISLASRDADYRPSIASALACRVTHEGQALTLFLPRTQAWQLLADIASCGYLAAVFTQPRSHRSVQIKAFDAMETVPEPDDLNIVTTQYERAAQMLSAAGYEDELLRIMFDYSQRDLTAIEMSVHEAYDQSPGPRAGMRLSRPS